MSGQQQNWSHPPPLRCDYSLKKSISFLFLFGYAQFLWQKKLVHNTNVLRHRDAKQSKVFDVASENCKINLLCSIFVQLFFGMFININPATLKSQNMRIFKITSSKFNAKVFCKYLTKNLITFRFFYHFFQLFQLSLPSTF